MRVPPSVPAAHMVVPRRSAWQCPACVGRTGAGRSHKEGPRKPVLAGPPLVRSPRMGDNGPMARPAGASAPVLVAVDDHPVLLRDVERELRHRYATDYRICCLSSTDEALATLQNLAAAGEQVALVLAGEVLSGAPGTELLAEVRPLFPHALRVLLIGWGRIGDEQTGDAIFEAIARGRMDHYLVRPARAPTSSSTWRCRASCSRGPRRCAAPRTRSRWSARPCPDGRTSCATSSSAAPCPTGSTSPAPTRGASSSPVSARARSCRSSSCPTGTSWRPPATPTSRERRGRRSMPAVISTPS